MEKRIKYNNLERIVLFGLPIILLGVIIYTSVITIRSIDSLSNGISIYHNHPYQTSNAAKDTRDKLLSMDSNMHDIEKGLQPQLLYDRLIAIESIMADLNTSISVINERYLGDPNDVYLLNKHFKELQSSYDKVSIYIPHLVIGYMGDEELTDFMDDAHLDGLIRDLNECWSHIYAVEYYLNPIIQFADQKAEELYTTAQLERENATKYLYRSALAFVLSMIAFFVILSLILQSKNKLIKDESNKFESALSDSPIPVIIHQNGKVIFVNTEFVRQTGYELFEIPYIQDLKKMGFGAGNEPTDEFLSKIYNLKEPVDSGIWKIKTKHGDIRYWHFYTGPLKDGAIISTALDVTKEKLYAIENSMLGAKVNRSQERIKLISEINDELNATEVIDEQDILDKTLDKALKLTRSEFGYIYFYSEKDRQFTLNSWSKEVMEAYSVLKNQTVFDLDKTGFWGEAVRQRKALILNDFQAPHPMNKGYPEGHVPIRKFMTTPVFEGNEIVAVVGVANKATSYNDSDIRELQLLINQVWSNIRRKKYEVMNQKLATAINQSPASIVITNTNGEIEYVNEYFTENTGYSMEEVIGQNPSILKSGHQDEKFYKSLWTTISKGEIWSGEFLNKKKDGTLFWESATISPITNSKGEVMNFVAVKEDITLKKNQEKMIINSLKEKEALLSEIHHRVKNNLAIITGLLHLEIFNYDDQTVVGIINNSLNRIKAIAAVHEELYQSQDFTKIKLDQHIKQIANDVLTSYHNNKDTEIELMFDLADVEININQAVPVGLLLNELLTNSILHAFKGMEKGRVYITLQEGEEDQLSLTVRDDGVGLSDEVPVTSLGFTLIQVLTEQLNGKLTHKNGVGYSTTIHFMNEEVKGIHDSMYTIL